MGTEMKRPLLSSHNWDAGGAFDLGCVIEVESITLEMFGLEHEKFLGFPSGIITHAENATLYYVYHDGPGHQHQATQDKEEALSVVGRFVVGSITTPERDGGWTYGNGERPFFISVADVTLRRLEQARTPIGRRINALRRQCRWSFGTLSKQTGLDMRLIFRHLNDGTTPDQDSLKLYAEAFSRHFRRPISPDTLE